MHSHSLCQWDCFKLWQGATIEGIIKKLRCLMASLAVAKNSYQALFGAENAQRLSELDAVHDARFSEHFAKIKAIPDVRGKLNFFDQATTEELSSPSFQVLEKVGQDPRFFEMCKASNFSIGCMSAYHLINIASIARRCKQLSNTLTSSLTDAEKVQIDAMGGSINTYIDSKIFSVLSRIIFSKNSPGTFTPSHPFYYINELMLQIRENNHESLRFRKITQITIRCDTGLGNALFIRGTGPGLNWDKGLPLTNKGSDLWVFEVEGEFPPFEYKILRNDVQWEEYNHKLVCGKQEERVLNYHG